MTGTKKDETTVRLPEAGAEMVADRYRLLYPLGEGGHGVVWCAEDTLLPGHEVAVKRLAAAHAKDPLARAELEREARVAIALTHPRLVRLHTMEIDKGRPVLVMERLRGPTLGAVLAARERLTEGEVRRIGAQVCEGLAHAHSEGIVHLDLKPSNLILEDPLHEADASLIAADAQVKITDFGIARVLTDTTARLGQHTAEQAAGGTLPYMSPEVIRGGPIDHRADIYSLGCLLYHLVSGRRPFSRGDIIHQHLNAAPPPIEDCPADLWEAIARCMRKEPSERFADCEALSRALRGERSGPSLRFTVAVACGISMIAGLSFGGWILAPRLMGAENPPAVSAAVSGPEPLTTASGGAAPEMPPPEQMEPPEIVFTDSPPAAEEPPTIEMGELIAVPVSDQEEATSQIVDASEVSLPQPLEEEPIATGSEVTTDQPPRETTTSPPPTEEGSEATRQAREALDEFTDGLGQVGRRANRGLERIRQRINESINDEE